MTISLFPQIKCRNMLRRRKICERQLYCLVTMLYSDVFFLPRTLSTARPSAEEQPPPPGDSQQKGKVTKMKLRSAFFFFRYALTQLEKKQKELGSRAGKLQSFVALGNKGGNSACSTTSKGILGLRQSSPRSPWPSAVVRTAGHRHMDKAAGVVFEESST